MLALRFGQGNTGRRPLADTLAVVFAQRGSLDVTAWLTWFLACLGRAVTASEQTLAQVVVKARFWELHRSTALTECQQRLVTRLLDGFEGKLISSKWARMAKCSQDTADLVSKGLLRQERAGGRSTSYRLQSQSPG